LETLFFLGVILALGAFTEWVCTRYNLSRVVGYMVVGLVIAPNSLGLIPQAFVANVQVVTDLALAMIAVMIGAEMKWSHIKGMRTQVGMITFFESFTAFLMVGSGFFLLAEWVFDDTTHALAMALLMGGVSAATAPAATLAVIREMKARGRFVVLLLGVVALDDAMAVILFALGVALADMLVSTAGIGLATFLAAVLSLVGSVGIGLLGGVTATLFERLFSHHKGMETISTLGVLFVVYSGAGYFGLEPLLSALVMGIVLTNFSKDFDLVEKEIDGHIAEVVFMLFFMISAMHLDPAALFVLPGAIFLYVILRFAGKTGGAYLGARLSGADHSVKRYLGFALIPQAGVAIGLALSLQYHAGFEPFASYVINVVIATTIIHELGGPLLTRYVLKQVEKENV
jgi:Kef-type K+ transport system membrane component KefB